MICKTTESRSRIARANIKLKINYTSIKNVKEFPMVAQQ